MFSPQDYQEASSELNDFEVERRRSPLFLIISALCALAVTGSLLAGYLYLQRRNAEQERARQQAMTPPEKPVIPPQAQVYEDEAMLKGAQAIIGGTVNNISKETLSDISVQLELIRRNDGTTEKRTLPLVPKDLAPNQQGRYTLSVLKRNYRGAHLVGISSGAGSNAIAFKTAPGAQRPPEAPPKATETIIVNKPAPRKGSGEEFINTPDDPGKIR
ncbi:MAG TPA: hypothetical protein VF708_20080 [Pyrinomonadaceae bacterium]|jgi:hypothetical protein